VEQPIVDLPGAATQLGRFVAALQRFDATGGPPSFRAEPVSTRDDDVRSAIRSLGAHGTVDAAPATAAWETSVAARRGTVPRSEYMPTLILGTCWPCRVG
jgi:hypothetical protein